MRGPNQSVMDGSGRSLARGDVAGEATIQLFYGLYSKTSDELSIDRDPQRAGTIDQPGDRGNSRLEPGGGQNPLAPWQGKAFPGTQGTLPARRMAVMNPLVKLRKGELLLQDDMNEIPPPRRNFLFRKIEEFWFSSRNNHAVSPPEQIPSKVLKGDNRLAKSLGQAQLSRWINWLPLQMKSRPNPKAHSTWEQFQITTNQKRRRS